MFLHLFPHIFVVLAGKLNAGAQRFTPQFNVVVIPTTAED
jgi:hypothetical protein